MTPPKTKKVKKARGHISEQPLLDEGGIHVVPDGMFRSFPAPSAGTAWIDNRTVGIDPAWVGGPNTSTGNYLGNQVSVTLCSSSMPATVLNGGQISAMMGVDDGSNDGG